MRSKYFGRIALIFLIIVLLLFVVLPLTIKWPYNLQKDIPKELLNFPIDIVIPWARENNLITYDFIEIGTANWDTEIQEADDNTKGISVEPLKKYLDDLPNKKNVIKVNSAISDIDEESTTKLYFIPEDVIIKKELPSWLMGCNSIGKYHDSHIEMNLKDYVKIIDVPVLSIPILFNKYNVKKTKYLKIDAEGHDPIILNSLYKWLEDKTHEYYPDKILFETTWHNTEAEKTHIINKYESIGYKSKNYDESNTLLILDVDKVKDPSNDENKDILEQKIHILHPGKTGGLSVRKALGCDCQGGIDKSTNETEHGSSDCGSETQNGRFICHGHDTTCADIPKDEPYIMISRDPYSRAASWKKYYRDNEWKLDLEFKNNSLKSYIDCPSHPPAMILRTEHLENDYNKFRNKFCKPNECGDIKHYHANNSDISILTESEREHIRKNWGSDFAI